MKWHVNIIATPEKFVTVATILAVAGHYCPLKGTQKDGNQRTNRDTTDGSVVPAPVVAFHTRSSKDQAHIFRSGTRLHCYGIAAKTHVNAYLSLVNTDLVRCNSHGKLA